MHRLSQALNRVTAPFTWIGKQILFGLIKAYQYLLSPWIGNQCRFHPTCSEYALEAINRFGVIKGGYLMIVRLLKCSPWHPGGFDPVPPEKSGSEQKKHGCCGSQQNS